MKRFIYNVCCIVVFISVLFIVSELYLAHKGVSICWYRERQRYMIERTPPALTEVARRCGWGYDKNWCSQSGEDPEVLQNTGADGLRVSRPILNKKGRHHTALFGCSFLFGEGVTDEDNVVYRLNERYPNDVFDNYGISGYGAVQSLIAMKAALNQNKYDLIVYCVTRPQFSRNLEKRVVGNLHINQCYCLAPRIEFYPKGTYKIFDNFDLFWPGQDKFLTIEWLHRVYLGSFYDLEIKNKVNFERTRERYKVMKKIIALMQQACREKKVRFLVASISDGAEGVFRDSPLDTSIEYISIDHPQSLEIKYKVKNVETNHPNKEVHAYWAKKFSQWYDENMLKDK
ncbi:MAG: SGNH/GDSL hydrolase family protein [Candidatus Bruticola sp.]